MLKLFVLKLSVQLLDLEKLSSLNFYFWDSTIFVVNVSWFNLDILVKIRPWLKTLQTCQSCLNLVRGAVPRSFLSLVECAILRPRLGPNRGRIIFYFLFGKFQFCVHLVLNALHLTRLLFHLRQLVSKLLVHLLVLFPNLSKFTVKFVVEFQQISFFLLLLLIFNEQLTFKLIG